MSSSLGLEIKEDGTYTIVDVTTGETVTSNVFQSAKEAVDWIALKYEEESKAENDDAEDRLKCPKCETSVTSKMEKCPECGTSLRQSTEDEDPELKAKMNEDWCSRKAVKFIDKETRRIGLYNTIWGERDCQDDRMTRKAVEPYVGMAQPLMLWKHGLDPEFGANPVGTWDVSSFKLDDKGWWSEGNITDNKWGDKAWTRLKKSNQVGGSLGSVWYLVQKNRLADGSKEIVNWPPLEISIMEGAKQCVPSAQNTIKADLYEGLSLVAAKMGATLPTTLLEESVTHGGIIMTDSISPEQVQDMVAKALADQAKRQEEEAASRRAELEMINAKAEELIAEKLPGIQEAVMEELREEVTEELETALEATLTERLAEEKEKMEQEFAQKYAPQAPPGYFAAPQQPPLAVKVFSRYDRLSTMDLAMRYEVMRSYGKNPSERFIHALEDRAKKMAREEDVVAIKGGQPVMAPAIDWEAIAPTNLKVEEMTGLNEEILSVKGQAQRFGRAGGYDAPIDTVTNRGVGQLAFIAAKADELSYSTQANAGDEWVPTLMAAQLWREIRLNAAVLGLVQQYDMPSQPHDLPVESTDPIFYKVGETTNEIQLILDAATAPFKDSLLGTGKVTFTAAKFGGISYWSEEMEEDSIIRFEPQIRDQYGIKMAHMIDEVLISGDETTGSTQISFNGASITSASRFLGLDGLRHSPLVTTTADSFDAGALTFSDFISARSKLGTAGKYGVNPSNLVYISDPGVFFQAMLLDEVVTVDKMGGAATILNGQLGSIGGIPLVVSEDFSLTDTSGYIDGATPANNAKGSFLCVNKLGWRIGWRRRPRIRVVGLPGADARYIVSSTRFDIQPFKIGMASLGYNVTI